MNFFFKLCPIGIGLFLVLSVLMGFSAGESSTNKSSAVIHGSKPPNFLIIVTDDQRKDTLTPEYMPNTWEEIVQQGLSFGNAFVTTPLCNPSRASIFTGVLPRHHGILRNTTNSSRARFGKMHHFPEDLRNAGYFTGLVGKFLNSWKGPWKERRKKEFDYWADVTLPKGKLLNDYFNFDLHLNTKVIHYRCAEEQQLNCAYITDELLYYASIFLKQASHSGKPFLLYFAPTAPHAPATAALEHENLYSFLDPYRPPSFAEPDLSDKPRWLRNASWISRDSEGHPYMEAGDRTGIDEFRLAQYRALASADDSIRALLEVLKQENVLDSTFILFTSDNGVYWSEHFLKGKNAPYEESIRVPFAVRFPRIISTNSPRIDDEHLIANIDIAPTIYDLAGLPIPSEVDGKSLLPILRNQKSSWREDLFFEGWPDKPGDIGDPNQCRPPFRAIRNQGFIYTRYDSNTGTGVPCVFRHSDDPELYDLFADPYQLQNIAGDPRYRYIQDELSQRLAAYPKVKAPKH